MAVDLQDLRYASEVMAPEVRDDIEAAVSDELLRQFAAMRVRQELVSRLEQVEPRYESYLRRVARVILSPLGT